MAQLLRRGWARLAAFARRRVWSLLAASLVAAAAYATGGREIFAGDGPEYCMMLESWFHHGSPDQRPEDARALEALLAAHGARLGRVHDGYFPDFSGRWYSYHAPLYSLLGVPAKAALRLMRGDELEALHYTNLALLSAAVVAVVASRVLTDRRRALLLALAALSPVLWYVRWPHAEVMLWALGVMGLLQLAARRHVWATVFFALAAMQSSPLMLVLAPVAASSFASRRRSTVVACALVALSALLPTALYWSHFRRTNLMADSGLLVPDGVGLPRLAGFVVDLNQGMLVHAPAVVLLGGVGVALALRARAWASLLLAAGTIGAMAATCTTVNWNAGACGMLRYGVWVTPMLAWLAARWLPRGRLVLAAATTTLAAQVVPLPWRVGADDSLFQGLVARYVLTHAPSLYDPEPEIFVERTLGRPTDAPWQPLPLPVGFADGQDVTKLLLDRDAVADLPALFDVDEAYLAELRARREVAGRSYYVEPPRGRVRVPTPPRALTTTRTTFARRATLEDGWLPVHHEGAATWACAGTRGSVRIDPPSRHLELRAWPVLEIGHPILLRIVAGNDQVLEERPVFGRLALRYTLLSPVSRVTFETSEDAWLAEEGTRVGLCVDSLDAREE